jgi:hypothetical protein
MMARPQHAKKSPPGPDRPPRDKNSPRPRRGTGEYQVELEPLGADQYKVLKAWDRQGKPLKFSNQVAEIDSGADHDLHGAVVRFLTRVARDAGGDMGNHELEVV